MRGVVRVLARVSDQSYYRPIEFDIECVENNKLNAELREARAQIRNLELQLEAVRTNARKAAQLLSDH